MQFHLTKSLEYSQTYQAVMPYMHMTTPIHFSPFFYKSTMTYIPKTSNIHCCAQTKFISTATSLMKYPLILIIQELLHSQSQLEITPSIWKNMVLRRAFTSDVHQKRNFNIAISFTLQMRINGRPTRKLHNISSFNSTETFNLEVNISDDESI